MKNNIFENLMLENSWKNIYAYEQVKYWFNRYMENKKDKYYLDTLNYKINCLIEKIEDVSWFSDNDAFYDNLINEVNFIKEYVNNL